MKKDSHISETHPIIFLLQTERLWCIGNYKILTHGVVKDTNEWTDSLCSRPRRINIKTLKMPVDKEILRKRIKTVAFRLPDRKSYYTAPVWHQHKVDMERWGRIEPSSESEPTWPTSLVNTRWRHDGESRASLVVVLSKVRFACKKNEISP